MARLLVGLGAVGAVLAGCSLVESRNSDPRAHGGSASDVALEKALDDNGIKLPEGAAGVRFAVHIGPNENFDLTFDTKCGMVPRFLKESSFKGSLESSVLLPSLVETAGREHDWKLESYPGTRGIEDDRLGPVDRSVIVAKAGGTSCKVFVSALR
jgi:hypothetical protein